MGAQESAGLEVVEPGRERCVDMERIAWRRRSRIINQARL